MYIIQKFPTKTEEKPHFIGLKSMKSMENREKEILGSLKLREKLMRVTKSFKAAL